MKLIAWALVKIICYSIVLYKLPRILWLNYRPVYEKQIHDFNEEFLESVMEYGGVTERCLDEGLIFSRQLENIVDKSWTNTTTLTPDEICTAVYDRVNKVQDGTVLLTKEEYEYLSHRRMAMGTDTTIMDFIQNNSETKFKIKSVRPHPPVGQAVIG